jgi:hypothetical protein
MVKRILQVLDHRNNMVHLVHLNYICIDQNQIEFNQYLPSQQLSASLILHSISIGQLTNLPDILHVPKPSLSKVLLTNVVLRSS